MTKRFALLTAGVAMLTLAAGSAWAAGPPFGARPGSTLGGPPPLAEPEDITEGFTDITMLPGLGWALINNSTPGGLTDWFQGNDAVFPAQAGASTSYIGANFNNSPSPGTISNWLITPEQDLSSASTLSFWTRQPTASTFPDRLQVRMSTNGASTNVGTLPTDVGDFTELLLDINPSLAVGGYPDSWTEFVVPLSAAATGTGRLAFRYFVTDAGPLGNNSDYIGIDTVDYVFVPGGGPSAVEVPTLGVWGLVLLALLLAVAAAFYLRRHRATT